MVNVFKFADTGEAYDASQCDDEIRNGDVLVTEDGVVGILCKAWPVAVTEKAGDFCQSAEGETIASAFPEEDYSESLRVAQEEVTKLPSVAKPGGIAVTYTSVDRFRERREFSNLADARAYAQERLGRYATFGTGYAVSDDGVGKIQVYGATLAELFPEG